MSNRVRSLITPKRHPSMDAMENLIDTHDGRNNVEPIMPRLDVGQVGKVLVAKTLQEPCYLCGEPSDLVTSFKVPAGLDLLGQSIILYGLCYGCKITPAGKGLAEGKLVLALQAENKAALSL